MSDKLTRYQRTAYGMILDENGTWVEFDEADTRIAELERICELNADALALYDKRGELIATLNEVRSRQEVRIAELERLVDSLSRVIADTTEGKGE